MKKLNSKILFLLFITAFYSCGADTKSEYFQEILKSEKGCLRGVEIGNSIEEIKLVESEDFLMDEMPDYLHYDYTISMGNTYTVTYDFSNENKLYELELAVFLDLVEDAGVLFQDFIYYFTRKYGKGRMADDGFMIWQIKSTSKNIEIAMINDSQSYGYLSIIIRDLDY